MQTAAPGSSDNGHPDAPPLLEAFVGYQVRRLHYRFVAEWQAYFAPLGIELSPVQGGTLLLIGQWGKATQKQLSERMGVDTASLHETLRPMIKAGLVQRTPSSFDKRSFELSLTTSGQQTAAILETEVLRHEAGILDRLSKTEVQQLRDLLAKVLAGRAE